MLGVIVALVVQGAWELTHRVLIENGLGHDRYVSSYALAIDIATYSALAIAAFDAARRLVLARKLGVQIAAWASLAMVAILVAGIPIGYLVPGDSSVHDTLTALMNDAWLALEIISIAGFAIASGRRGAWLGAIAIGFALLRRHPEGFVGLGLHVGFTALVLGERVLIAVMAVEIGRSASPPEPDPDRAVRALRWLELVAWLDAAFGVVDVGLHAADIAQIVRSLASLSLDIVTIVVVVASVWSLVRAAIPRMPRWPFVFAMVCSIAAQARTSSAWFGMLVRWWGRLDEVPLKPAHWIVTVPPEVAVLASLASLVVFARRIGARELSLASAIAFVASAATFIAQVAIGVVDIPYLMLYVASAACIAIAYRRAQPAVHRAIKLTDVFS